MMSEPSSKSFLEALRRSNLVAEDRLVELLAGLRRSSSGEPPDLELLIRHLLEAEVVTPWHVEKLRNGKYKGFFLGQYKLLRLLGTGGMSTVYLAQHKLSGHQRAIKVLPKQRAADKSYLERFYREGRAAASLNHPNIVRIYDLANEGEVHYMVMEYVEGIDLHQKVKQEGPLDYGLALNCTRQAAEGLAHAHAQHIVHRDIKPANLLMNARGTVKILDLGLALMREELESITLLHNERVMGTADFLAPEQAIDSHNVDPRADIYSLGCTFYFLLTGHPPFPTGTIPQRIAAHQNRQPPPLRFDRQDCPPAIEALTARMMRKKPEERFQSCQEVVEALREVELALSSRPQRVDQPFPANSPPPVGRGDTAPPKIKIRRRKSTTRASYVVMSVVVLVMFAFLLLLLYFVAR